MSKLISTKQLMYSAAGFIIASSLLTSNLYQFARNASWFSVVLGFTASLIIIEIYTLLSKRHPGLSLIEINDIVFGTVVGKAVSAFYIFYFLSLSYFNTRNLGDFVKSMLLPSTPIMIIFIIFLIICSWAVRKGPAAMTRYGFLLSFVTIMAILFNLVLLLNKVELKNLLPVFTLPVKNYLIGAHIVTMLPFCEIMAFMMFIPFLGKPESFGQALRRGLYIGSATLLMVVLRDTMVLGKFYAIFSMPTFSSIRLIDIGDILTRLEIVYAVILMMMLFFKVSIVYFATVSGISRLFRIDSHQSFIHIIGALVVVYAAASFSSVGEHVKWNMTAAATYSSMFLFILPVLTLVVSAVRGYNQNRLIRPEER